MSAEKTLGWMGFALNVVAALGIGHGIWTVYSKRAIIQWSARHFRQLFYALNWSVLFVFVERNLQLFAGILQLFELSFAVRWFLNNLFGTTFLALFLLRAWLIHYDFHSGVALSNLVSNPKLTAAHKEHFKWFLDNKRNYGAPKYMTRFTFMMLFIINLFLLAWSLASPSTFVYAVVFLYAVFIVISISVTRHITVLDDNFFIRQEILNEFRAFATMFVIGGIIIIFGPPMGWNWAGFFLIELSVIVVLVMCWYATFWVLKKTYKAGLDSVNGLPVIKAPQGSPPLSVALGDRTATTQLVKHLVNEVSVENIFFLSDLMVYKKSFVRNGPLNTVGNGFKCEVGSTFARLIYRRTFTHYAWAISKTYVDGSSSLLVTAINDETREEILRKLEDMDPSDETPGGDSDDAEIQRQQTEKIQRLEALQNIFDKAGAEVYDQLKKSYARFAHTGEFGRISIQRKGTGMLAAVLVAEQTKK